MKRSLILLLTFIICISLFAGCGKNYAPPGAIKLYYCHSEFQYGSESGVVHFEYYKPPADATAEQNLQRYLNGPADNGLVSPFPAKLRLNSMELKDNKVQITLSKELAELNNIDLTIACACITLTVQQITGYSTVDIRAQEALLNNQKSIVMDANELMLSDIIAVEP